MSHYRIYLLDTGGRIAAAHDADCTGDDEARANAVQLAITGQWAELWHGTRRVGQVKSGHTAPVIDMGVTPVQRVWQHISSRS